MYTWMVHKEALLVKQVFNIYNTIIQPTIPSNWLVVNSDMFVIP